MADPIVEKLKQRGVISLWTFLDNKKNYPGWHFSADRVGADFLLQLFDKMVNAKWSSFKDINISQPTHKLLKVPNNMNGRARWRSPKIFKLKYPKGLVSKNHWHLEVMKGSIILVIGLDKLNEFRDGVENIIKDKGDYAIGPNNRPCENNLCLWFWGFGEHYGQ